MLVYLSTLDTVLLMLNLYLFKNCSFKAFSLSFKTNRFTLTSPKEYNKEYIIKLDICTLCTTIKNIYSYLTVESDPVYSFQANVKVALGKLKLIISLDSGYKGDKRKICHSVPG